MNLDLNSTRTIATKATATKATTTKATATNPTATRSTAARIVDNASTVGPVESLSSNVKTEMASEDLHEPYSSKICFICADKSPEFWALTECNHRVCSLCILRLRTLYNTYSCPVCKTIEPKVLITSKSLDAYAEFASLFTESLPHDKSLQFWFETDQVMQATLKILKLNCPADKCTKAFSSKPELRKHVSNIHKLSICDICFAHKKVFAHEFKLFTRTGLMKHQKEGDGGGSKGHPSCTLCGTMFYSDDELQIHIREKHEKCHICARNKVTKSFIFRDYKSLEDHFRNEHYYCPEKVCLELKFVVFETELEYKAHRAEMHIGERKLQRSSQNQLRRIDPSFVIEGSSTGSRQNQRQRLGQGEQVTGVQATQLEPTPITRNPSSSTLPPTSSLPTRPPPVHINPNILFGANSLAPIVDKLQSLSLYEKRNDDLLSQISSEFKLSPLQLKQFKTLCRDYQQEKIAAHEFVTKTDTLYGTEFLRAIFPKLIDLQLNSLKKAEMNAQYWGHLHKLESFPLLPSAKSSVAPVNTAPPTKTIPCGKVLTLRPNVSRPVHPHSVFTSRTSGIAATSDPVKNPIKLIRGSSSILATTVKTRGFDSGKDKNKSTTQTQPSFHQALQSGTTSCAPITKPTPIMPTKKFEPDESQFPSLISKPKTAIIGTTAVSSNVFSQSEDRNEPEAFTIGGDDTGQIQLGSSALSEIPQSTNGDERIRGKKKSKKGILVFKYGQPTL